jgi:hypothetical protein
MKPIIVKTDSLNGLVYITYPQLQELDMIAPPTVIECTSEEQYQDVINNILLETKTEDRLAELEKQILEYFLSKGFKLKKDQKEDDTKWFFEVNINSKYKQKTLEVVFYYWSDADYTSGWEESNKDSFTARTTKEMFDKAFEYFKVD